MVGYIFIGCVVALIILAIVRKDDYIIHTVYADDDAGALAVAVAVGKIPARCGTNATG